MQPHQLQPLLTQQAAAAASYDAFDDRYLGDKASDPTLDNDGNALLTGALYFNTTSDVMKVYDGSAWNIAAISSASPTFTGTVTADGLSLGDNDKATFGAGNDLEIYHDGSDSYINDSGTGDLKIGGNQLQLNNAAQTKNYIYAVDGAQVELKYDNALKLATTATGIDVTGTATMDGLTSSEDIYVSMTDPELRLVNTGSAGGEWRLLGSEVAGSVASFRIYQTGVGNRLKVADNGDISFYEDTGTTPKFFWDASAERLGVGTVSPTYTLQANSGATTTTVRLQANAGVNPTLSFLRGATEAMYAEGTFYGGNVNYVQALTFSQAGTEKFRFGDGGHFTVGSNYSST
jgi:hypothetical protein